MTALTIVSLVLPMRESVLVQTQDDSQSTGSSNS